MRVCGVLGKDLGAWGEWRDNAAYPGLPWRQRAGESAGGAEGAAVETDGQITQLVARRQAAPRSPLRPTQRPNSTPHHRRIKARGKASRSAATAGRGAGASSLLLRLGLRAPAGCAAGAGGGAPAAAVAGREGRTTRDVGALSQGWGWVRRRGPEPRRGRATGSRITRRVAGRRSRPPAAVLARARAAGHPLQRPRRAHAGVGGGMPHAATDMLASKGARHSPAVLVRRLILVGQGRAITPVGRLNGSRALLMAWCMNLAVRCSRPMACCLAT